MYSKLGRVSSVLGIMSERHHQDFLPAKKDEENEIEPDIQIRPAPDDPKGCPNIAPSCHLSLLQIFQELHNRGGDDDGRKDQEKVIEPGNSTRPTTQDPEGCPDFPPSSHLSELRGFREVRGEGGDDKEQQLGKSEVAEDDDGFRTPDSLEHRIPVIRECPPAPKKIRPKISSAKRSRTTAELLDLSNEVESLFPPKVEVDSDTMIKKKIKREEDGSEL